ncbi:MAG: VCBS repeat-containing protein, partial [Planctomycetota bacterium]
MDNLKHWLKVGGKIVIVPILFIGVIQIWHSVIAQEKPAGPYFTEVTKELGLGEARAYRLSAADVNGDSYQDLAIHVGTDLRKATFFYLNKRGKMFTDFTKESGVRANRDPAIDGRRSSLMVFGDIDNDGDMDMFSGVHVHRRE